MAKGDNERARDEIDTQVGTAQTGITNLRDRLVPQNDNFWNNYNTAAGMQMADYGNLMNEFDTFSKTGGYSDGDLQNIRARSVSPIRSAYANASRDTDRNLSLQGGYVPGFNAAKAKLARESSYAMSDASQNVEGMIAQMVQQGKLAGAQGKLGVYGSTPGMMNSAANAALGSSGQLLGVEGLQGDLARTAIQGKIGVASIPGKWKQAFDNIMNAGKVAGGAIGALGGLGGGSSIPSSQTTPYYDYPGNIYNQDASQFMNYPGNPSNPLNPSVDTSWDWNFPDPGQEWLNPGYIPGSQDAPSLDTLLGPPPK